MSDEKRQTRLLPFRLRRAGARRHGAGAGLDGAGLDGAGDFSADPELSALLRAWEAPPHDDARRALLLAGFRAEFGRAPLWRRALAARLRVPVPVAACAALALALLSLAALKSRQPPAQPAPASPAAVRVVEVPVVQERVVTRTVYVEKKGRGAERGAPTRGDSRVMLAGSNQDGARAEQPNEAEPAQQQSPETHAGYYTRVDMNDFQPTDEMKIRVVRRGGVDEK